MPRSALLRSCGAGLVILGAVLSFGAPVIAQEPAPITLTVTGIEEMRGDIVVALFPGDSWSGRPVASASAAAGSREVIVELSAPGAGQYAIRLFHDVDGDGELDTNLLGIPSEPYGFSNNAPARFGPPSLEDAIFDVPAGGVAHSISLQG